MEEKLRDAQLQINELKHRNKALEEQLRISENGKNVGKMDTETVKPGAECIMFTVRYYGHITYKS